MWIRKALSIPWLCSGGCSWIWPLPRISSFPALPSHSGVPSFFSVLLLSDIFSLLLWSNSALGPIILNSPGEDLRLLRISYGWDPPGGCIRLTTLRKVTLHFSAPCLSVILFSHGKFPLPLSFSLSLLLPSQLLICDALERSVPDCFLITLHTPGNLAGPRLSKSTCFTWRFNPPHPSDQAFTFSQVSSHCSLNASITSILTVCVCKCVSVLHSAMWKLLWFSNMMCSFRALSVSKHYLLTCSTLFIFLFPGTRTWQGCSKWWQTYPGS